MRDEIKSSMVPTVAYILISLYGAQFSVYQYVLKIRFGLQKPNGLPKPKTLVGLIRLEWNTLIPYMEEIAAAMQNKIDSADSDVYRTLALLRAVSAL